MIRRTQVNKSLEQRLERFLPHGRFLNNIVFLLSILSKTMSEEEAPRLGEDNVGFKMLKLLGGYKGGGGLGKSEQGIAAPIQVKPQEEANLGLGKGAEFDHIAEEATKQGNRWYEDSQEIIERKIETANREGKIEEERTLMNASFFCEICNKQYKNIAEIEEHLKSYDHAHKKRALELKEGEKKRKRESGGDAREEQRRKEERRLAKELENRIKAHLPPSQPSFVPPPPRPPTTIPPTSSSSSSSSSSSQYSVTATLSSSLSETTFDTKECDVSITHSSVPTSEGTIDISRDAPPIKFGFSMGVKKKK